MARDAPAAGRARDEADFDVWRAGQWALLRIDPRAGAEVAIATLRRPRPTEGDVSLPIRSDAPPTGCYADPASVLCGMLIQGDAAAARERFAQLAGDEDVSVGVRRRALLALARLGDDRATGSALAHDPLTADPRTVVGHARAEAHGGSAPSTGSGVSHGHHHHWH